jgi:hypothetical protein
LRGWANTAWQILQSMMPHRELNRVLCAYVSGLRWNSRHSVAGTGKDEGGKLNANLVRLS